MPKDIICEVQQEVFHVEYSALKKGNAISKDSKLRRYSQHLDFENIIRMKSRIQEAEYVSSNFRSTMKHPLTILTIDEVYKNLHFTMFLNELLERFIISPLRSALSSATYRCLQRNLKLVRFQLHENKLQDAHN